MIHIHRAAGILEATVGRERSDELLSPLIGSFVLSPEDCKLLLSGGGILNSHSWDSEESRALYALERGIRDVADTFTTAEGEE
jgi:hypothetical protein